ALPSHHLLRALPAYRLLAPGTHNPDIALTRDGLARVRELHASRGDKRAGVADQLATALDLDTVNRERWEGRHAVRSSCERLLASCRTPTGAVPPRRRRRGTQAGLGSPNTERRALPRDGCITAAADTIADREWRRGLHPVPDDMLLAPGTDDLETGHGSPRVLPSFMPWRSLLSHRCTPSLM